MDPVARLVVIRHAKAQDEAATDRARKLTDRGEGDARAAGQWLVATGHVPQLLLASPADRSRRTAELVAAALPTGGDVVLVDELYEASAAEVLRICTEAIGAAVGCAAVVGHNPAMAELTGLVQAGDGDSLVLRPGAVAVFEVDRPWSGLGLGQARLVDRFAPG